MRTHQRQHLPTRMQQFSSAARLRQHRLHTQQQMKQYATLCRFGDGDLILEHGFGPASDVAGLLRQLNSMVQLAGRSLSSSVLRGAA